KDSNNEARAPVSAEPHLEASLPTAGGNAQELMGVAPPSFISPASPDNSSERSPDEATTDSPKLELVHDSARDEAANTIASMQPQPLDASGGSDGSDLGAVVQADGSMHVGLTAH